MTILDLILLTALLMLGISGLASFLLGVLEAYESGKVFRIYLGLGLLSSALGLSWLGRNQLTHLLYS